MICIPELNCWLNKLYFESAINEGTFYFPSYITLSRWGVGNSVINLLFNECTTQTAYDYNFKYIAFSSIPEPMLQTRLSIVRSETESAGIYVCDTTAFQDLYVDSTTYNVLQFNEEEIMMLDELLYFRANGIYDSTSFVNIDYNSLTSPLSKMIYLYLIFIVEQDYSLYNDQYTLADSTCLVQVCFEKYLVDTYYKVISRKYLNLDSTAHIQVNELNVLATASLPSSGIGIQIPYEPFDNNSIILIYNGCVKKYETDFIVIYDVGSWWIRWDLVTIPTMPSTVEKVFVIYPYF